MEIAFGMLGLAITVLGIVFAYIWKSNGKLQMNMMTSLENMMTALERIEAGQQKGFEQIEKGYERLEKGIEHIGKSQERGTKILAEMLIKQTEMITTQTIILEKIENRI